MKSEIDYRFLWTVSLFAALIAASFASASTRAFDHGKLRDAWLRLDVCREPAVAENQEARLERCLSTALPSSATALEKLKVVEFLLLDLKPKSIFECPSGLSDARGEKANKQAQLNGIHYECFEIKLSGPPIKGEIEFWPEADDTFRVRKVRYGF
jgi:hypothetical protein